MSDATLAAIARRQHGLVTTAQSLSHLTGDQGRYRLHTGRLERVHPGVYRIAGAPEGWEPSVMAAVMAAGDGAVASFVAGGGQGLRSVMVKSGRSSTPMAVRAAG